MALAAYARVTEEEYLARERCAETKSEFVNGEIFAMSGAREPHNLVAMNVGASLHSQFRGRPCRVYGSDMRVRVSATGLNTYPDVSALCGPPRFHDAIRDTLLNPQVLVEVLSESTEAWDRGGKWEHYQRLESLTDYLLIAQDRVRVEHFTRGPDGAWTCREYTRMEEVIELQSVGARLEVEAMYDKVIFP